MTKDIVLEAKDLKKYYRRGPETVKALDGIDLILHKGEIVSIVGPSGSGKTTLLNLISCLDTPTSGELFIGGEYVSLMKESELISVRRKYIGFIFQQFYLIPNLYPAENVELPLIFAKKKIDTAKVEALLDAVGLEGRKLIPSYMLSGGDKQRVAIARALVNDPQIIIADEPTGKLELKVRDQLMDLFKQLASRGTTVFIATHDLELASMTERVIYLQDGKIVS
jgi:putative ABC transport system ATP-binding protein